MDVSLLMRQVPVNHLPQRPQGCAKVTPLLPQRSRLDQERAVHRFRSEEGGDTWAALETA